LTEVRRASSATSRLGVRIDIVILQVALTCAYAVTR